MSGFLLTVLCLISYGCGLAVLLKVTPMLVKRKFDDVFFMGLAAAVIIGSLLVFAPIGILFSFFNSAFAVRTLDVIMLLGIALVAVRIAYRCFRPSYKMEVIRLSGILTGSYYLLVLVLTAYALVLMFVQTS
ncbi:MAG TPA: hypothetical protein VJO32_04785 [Ktedonobacteraceae bacterium]|nr:hypothetical protein [Ktedonobacteraceae bacterium]